MIAGIGIDVVDVSRVQKSLSRWGSRWTGKIYTACEIELCEQGTGDHSERYAARFAAKEAFFKAAPKADDARFFPKKIEVRSLASGAPQIVHSPDAFPELEKMAPFSIHVSITHEKNVAAAVVIIEK